MVNADENGNPVDPASIGMEPEWPGETLVHENKIPDSNNLSTLHTCSRLQHQKSIRKNSTHGNVNNN